MLRATCYVLRDYMEYPTYNLEKKLIKQGYKNIVGIDEVGRGALAGPIVAVATIIFNFPNLPSGRQLTNSKQIRDSKLLSEKQREKIFNEISNKVIWSIGIASHKEIDKIGITRANILAIKRAINKLETNPNYLLLDRVSGFTHRLPFESIIKGDNKVLSISIASILAKVTRDRIMRKLHQKYPVYHFYQHKGYGTALHLKCLKEFGICKIHRQSYEPVKKILNSKD